MKRIITTLIISIAIFCAASIVASAAVFTVGEVEIEQGTTTVSMPLTLSDNSNTVASIQLNVVCESPITMTKKASQGDALADYDFSSYAGSPVLVWAWDDVGLDEEGVIANIPLNVPADIAAGDYEVTVDVVVFATTNEDYEEVELIDTVSVVPGKITVKGEEPAATLTAKGTSLYLDGGVGVKAYFEYTGAEALMINGAAATLEADGSYSAYVEVAPKDFATQSVTFTATAADVEDATVTATVAEMINTYKDDAKVGALATALEAYCINANAFFLGGETQAVEANITLEKPVYTGTKTINGITFKSSSLILKGKVTLRHYFKAADGADTTGFQATEDGFLYIEEENINVTDLATKKTLTAGGFAIEFSALDYVALTHDSDDVKLANLVKALYNYHVAAVAYEAAN